jgi:hypothetical protein
VSEGGDFVDPVDGTVADKDDIRLHKLKDRCAQIRANKMTLGVYHLLRPRTGRSGDVEADFAVRVARQAGWGLPGDLRLVVDVELTDLGPKPTHTYVTQFVTRYQKLTIAQMSHDRQPIVLCLTCTWSDKPRDGVSWAPARNHRDAQVTLCRPTRAGRPVNGTRKLTTSREPTCR